ADILDDGGDRPFDLLRRQLLGQELLDYRNFQGFLALKVRAPRLGIDGSRLAALLEHLLQGGKRVGLAERVGAQGNFAFLQGGADETQGAETRLVLRPERCLEFLLQTIAHCQPSPLCSGCMTAAPAAQDARGAKLALGLVGELAERLSG